MPVAMRTTYQKAEAKYNVTTEFPSLGLHSAAATGNVGLVEYALDHGQPINSVLDGVLPLHAACAGGNVQVVKLLIEHGADVNAPRLPRRYSNDRNRDSSAPIVGTSGSTPLHFAAANGNTEAVNLLLLHGAHANRPDKHGITPEMLARQHGWLECADVLKQWLLNKDRDLRERPGGTAPNDSKAGPSRERIGSFSSDTDSQLPSTRRRLHVKHSIDNALNKLKSSTTDMRLHAPSSTTGLATSTPPASPTKPLGEYTFIPTPSSDTDAFDASARRPSLPQILQPPSVTSSRSRKTSTPNATHSPSPRRPRSAGNGAEGQEPETATPPGKSGIRKLGSKYSLMNIFKKAQAGESVQTADIPQSLAATSPPASSSALPTSSSPGQPSPLQHVAATESTSTRSGFRFHRGSDASSRTAPQQSSSLQPLNHKASGTMAASPRPSAVDLHNALVQDRDERQRRSRDRSRSTGNGARFSPVDKTNQSPSPSSSPLQRLGLLRGQGHVRDRSGSGSSLGTSPGYRGGAIFDDDVVVVAGDGEPSRSGARPSILKAHTRTSSSGHIPGTPQGFRALRFDSSSSNGTRDPEGLRTMHILRGSNSTGSLGRRRNDIFGREATPEPRVSEENLAPDSAPATMIDFSRPENEDEVADDEDEEEYGQPLHNEDSPVIDSGEINPSLHLRERGGSFASSQSSLSPIMPDGTTMINDEFPFSINKPPVMEPEDIEQAEPKRNLLRVPSSGDNRTRGDSVSSTSTTDSNNPQLSASGTTSGSGSETVTTPWLSSPGRDEFLDVVHSNPGQHDDDAFARNMETPGFKGEIVGFSERRHHTPPGININSISSHAQAEALVQKAQQDILEMANDLTPASGSIGRSPLSARLAAYGESLALERKLREKKELEERQALENVRSRQASGDEPYIRSPATTPTRINIRRISSNGVERQRSLEHRPTRTKIKTRGKDPKRPSTAEGRKYTQTLLHGLTFNAIFLPPVTPRSADQATEYLHQSSQSSSGLAVSPPSRLLLIEPDTPSDEQEQPPLASNSTNLSISQPGRAPSPGPRTYRSRTPVPESGDGHLSRVSSQECADTDTELGPALFRVSTAPHGAARGAKTATKLTRMGFPPMEQVRTAPTNNKRFGAFRSLVQTLKGKT
ncbi:hypothetical protein H0H87_007291 [Tephrocybe sp. NHM501043]|nr:hypothetical protein H0H87_007291 [Tephrocybe sp. NHM501043]